MAEKLTAMGTPDAERNVGNKINQGGFTAAFFVQWLAVIGVKEIRLG